MTRREQELWAIAERELTDLQLKVLRHWMDGHSIRKIAIAMNRSEATIRGHLHRAFQRMKPYLRKDAA